MRLIKFWFSVFFGLLRFSILVFLGWVAHYFTGYDWFACFVVIALITNCIEHIAIDVKDK